MLLQDIQGRGGSAAAPMKYVKWGEKSQPISTLYVRIQQHCYTNAIPEYRNLSTGFMLQTGS